MADDKTLTITVIVVFLAAIVIIMYFLFFRNDENIIFPPDQGPEDPPDDPPDQGGDDDTDPYFPPGFQFINLDRTVSHQKEIIFNFNAHYYATSLSGSFRVGGSIWTNVKIFYKKNGTWSHRVTVGGFPGEHTQFQCLINEDCEGIGFRAEQGILPWIGDRYIDEVNAQLLCEVG